MWCAKRPDAFSGCHPALNFLYFAAVILFSLFMDHPIILGISFMGAAVYAVCLQGWRRVIRFNLLLTMPAMAVIALLNPLFNHYGVTFLFYLKTGPVTLEAIVYGAVLASMVFIAILWFSCYNEVMTTDKFVYLFGRLIPALSLVLAMVLRFVPRFGTQLAVIRSGQKAIGRDMRNGGLRQRISHGINIFSILTTWALENAIETSDSMRARGYGLKGRTAFSIFRFDRRDLGAALVMALLLAICVCGFSQGICYASYDPVIRVGGLPLSAAGVVTYLAWAGFCFFPVILRMQEEAVFRRLQRTAGGERALPWYMAGQEGKG